MTTHDGHRSMDENLFNSFKPSLIGSAPFRSINPSDLAELLPGTSPRRRPTTPQTQDQQQQRQHEQQHQSTSQQQQQQQHQREQSSRPSSRRGRPSSDILQAFNKRNSSAEEAIDRWYENIQRYEKMLEDVAAASLDQEFKDELQHINQWFRCRSDAERTAALYTLVQNASQIQIRFLITVLQQLANQDPLGALLSPAGQDKDSNGHHSSASTFGVPMVAGSVVSTESEYEMRKRQMYPPSRRTARTPFCSRLTSALSEPDDLRRNRSLFQHQSLYQEGVLLEKALEARAQIQAANPSSSSRVSSASSSSSSSTLNSVGFSPRLKASCSASEPSHTSLFGSDWRFSLVRNPDRSPTKTSLPHTPVTPDDSWSFGSLSSRKDIWGTRKSHTIREDQMAEQESPSAAAAAALSMLTLEQAQARLRGDATGLTSPSSLRVEKNRWSMASSPRTTLPPTPSSENTRPLRWQQESFDTLEPLKQREATEGPVKQPLPSPAPAAQPSLPTHPPHYGQFLTPTVHEPQDDDLSDHSDQVLTGSARRRKRSSAARALKDKLAAETVDFELMKDVQNWLRSLRLHKYGHAFVGLEWQQVIRMSDKDMDDAGVNTIGARRKLLKVFENVQLHCKDNGIDF